MSAMQGVTSGRRGSRKRKSARYKFSKKKGVKRARGAPQRFATGIEVKFHDLDIDDVAIAAAGTITPSVVLIAQGTTDSTRDGRKVTVTNIGWKFLISMEDAQTPGSGDVVRVILYHDKQANGAAATVSAAVDADGILDVSDFQSFNNLANSGRSRTLMDRTYDIQRTAAEGNGTTYQYGEVMISDSF